MDDPNWPRASAWARGTEGRLGLLGIPLHRASITPGRCDLAPAAVRAALARYSTWDFESGVDLRDLPAADLGDLDVATRLPEEAFEAVSRAVAAALIDVQALVLLGGDNSITWPACHGAGPLESLGLLTLDAHLDLRGLDGGHGNGNPVRALLADGMPGSQVVQAGIQSFANSPAYAQVARRENITVIPVEEVRARGIEAVVSGALDRLAARVDRIYVDLDLDVLDRAFAPAAPGSRPGGLAPWEARRAAAICGRHPKVRVLDLVEIDPQRDLAETTVLAAAACLLSFASGVAGRKAP
ncbi:MAG: arginase family protein [Bryobacterales bacterium]|nr:arginase family protein [Bryobacterales bacterium]